MHRREVTAEGFRACGMISNCIKDKHEELSFFRDIQKREKEQAASLLQPVSEEFEANGNYGLYRMESEGRKRAGFDTGKNDYNWLKTPPATPLFPSLEMETNGQELVIQREIPILQPLSRFAESSQGTKASSIPISPKPKPKLLQRYTTPNARPSISPSFENKNMKSPPIINQKKSIPVKSTPNEKVHPNFPTSSLINLTKNATTMEPNSSINNLKNRGLSDNTPPNNLRTTTNHRPASTTRGRSTNQNYLPAGPQKEDASSNLRRQSCSPSVTRGRKVVDSDNKSQQHVGNRGGGGQVLGSRMVDRFMNSRISSGDERQSAKIKVNESSGFGRLMSKTSLDMAIKHTEFQKDSSISTRKHGIVQGRKS
ncbi:PREDICTED: zonadhesin-like [Erythranthe guttata]|nr:PREDICTED: zonadhesin-like [Erythranthe guttata]|eukprot:XP_012837557.1 PREDICTED: zonadhesin-like [Erythranthe guttata]